MGLFAEKLDDTIRIKFPVWLPATLKREVADRGRMVVHIDFTRGERRVLRKKKRIKPSEWAPKHRVVTMGNFQGPWRNEVTPWSAGIMDAIDFPTVRVANIRKCPQSGITEAVITWVGCRMDQAPMPVVWLLPDKETAKENSNDRIIPMFRSSAKLRQLMTGSRDDETGIRINLKVAPIYMAWAGSATRLGNKPAGIAIADEVNKYVDRAGKKESSPMMQLDKRLNTYRDVSKFIRLSTPNEEGEGISKCMAEAQVIFVFYVCCPDCGGFQLMTDLNIKFPSDERDPEKIKNEKLAWYECDNCQSKWDDDKRDQAALKGQWRDSHRGLELFTYLETYRPANIGFELPAYFVRFVSLSETASALLKGLSDPIAHQDYVNQYKAEDWKVVIKTTDQESLLRCRTSLPPQTVPALAVALTCGIDMQSYGYWYIVRAWARNYTNWLIDYNLLDSFADVEELLWGEASWYPIEGSNIRMRIWRAGLDTGGSKINPDVSMTDQAYLWLQQHRMKRAPKVWGTKGASGALDRMMKRGSELRSTPNGRPLKNGFRVWHLDTDKFKDMLHDRFERVAESEPGAAYLHEKTGMDYVRQILAEHKKQDRDGNTGWHKTGKDNHYLDCEGIAAALAHWEWPGGGVNRLKGRVCTDETASAAVGPVVGRSKFLS